MLAELQHISAPRHAKPEGPGSDQAHANPARSDAHRSLRQTPGVQPSQQEHSPAVARAGSHDSLEDRSSPQLIYSRGFQAGEHQYMLNQQQDNPNMVGFAAQQHRQDLDQSDWPTHDPLSQQQPGSNGSPAYEGSGLPNTQTSRQQRHSFDGVPNQDSGQLAGQQQLLYRSQSLTYPSQQAAVQKHGMHSPLLQQQATYGQPQSANNGPSGAHDLVKHLQRHSTGQTYPEASQSMPYQLPSHSHSQQQPQFSPRDWFGAQTQASQTQPQPQPSAQSNPWASGEGLYQAGLPKKKSSGDMSRHGSGSTDGPLSDYVRPDSVRVSARHS